MVQTDDQRGDKRPANDGASQGEQDKQAAPFAPSFPTAAPPPLPDKNGWGSEWFAPPSIGQGASPTDASAMPAYRPYQPYVAPVQQYPPPPEMYRAMPAPSAGIGLPHSQSGGGAPSHNPGGMFDASGAAYPEYPAYPPYAPGGVVDAEGLRAAPNPHQTVSQNGHAEAADHKPGASIISVLWNFLLPPLSAVVSFWLYAALLGWQIALGIMVLLFVHEMGHFVVIRAKGMPASLPIFIPLLGAFVAMKSLPHNVRDEAEIGIAGPIAGGLGGLICLALYFQTHLLIMIPLAYFSFLINLLNLVPVAPLDGARVTGAISRWFWPVGLVLLAIGYFYTRNVFILMIGAIGVFQMFARFRASPMQRAYYAISPWVRIYITALYFGLIAALTLGMFLSQSLAPGLTSGFF